VIPLCDIKVRCRLPGIKQATLQPENDPLPLSRTKDAVEALVPRLNMHSMVIFE
jgi:hypothetical protein